MDALLERATRLPVPSPVIAPFAPSPPAAQAGPSAARGAGCWERVAVEHAANPIADLAGYGAALRHGQGLQAAERDLLEIGCGTGTTALCPTAFTWRQRATDVLSGMVAIARQGIDIVSVERRGTRGKHTRVFIVARRPA
jgi:hypothetical protein